MWLPLVVDESREYPATTRELPPGPALLPGGIVASRVPT
jgi:hypothetical protein